MWQKELKELENNFNSIALNSAEAEKQISTLNNIIDVK